MKKRALKELLIISGHGDEGSFFFLDGKYITNTDPNDASWSGEYFEPILEALGARSIHKSFHDFLGKRVADKLSRELMDMGDPEPMVTALSTAVAKKRGKR